LRGADSRVASLEETVARSLAFAPSWISAPSRALL